MSDKKNPQKASCSIRAGFMEENDTCKYPILHKDTNFKSLKVKIPTLATQRDNYYKNRCSYLFPETQMGLNIQRFR